MTEWNELYNQIPEERRAEIHRLVEQHINAISSFTPAGDVVRSWTRNLVKEAKGMSLTIMVGDKYLDGEGWLLNLAAAVDNQDNKRSKEASLLSKIIP